MIKLLRMFTFILVIGCRADQQLNETDSQNYETRESEGYGYIGSGNEMMLVPFKKVGSNALIGGDILFPLNRIVTEIGSGESLGLARFSSAIKLWPGGRVPYILPENFWAMDEWNFSVAEWARAGITFVPWTPQDKNAVVIVEETDPKLCGHSDLGMQGGAQRLFISKSPTCDLRHFILHEGAHAVGFMHEHQRSDRDNFIQFLGAPPTESYATQVENTLNSTPYDLASITHYGTSQIPNMRTRSGAKIQRARKLSAGDIEGVRRAYAAVMQTQETPAANAQATPPQTTTSPAEVKQCRMVGVAQATFFNQQLTRILCEKECFIAGGSSPHRRCEWGGKVFRAHPLDRCEIKRAGGKILSEKRGINIQDCRMECGRFASSNPGRICTWGNENVKK